MSPFAPDAPGFSCSSKDFLHTKVLASSIGKRSIIASIFAPFNPLLRKIRFDPRHPEFPIIPTVKSLPVNSVGRDFVVGDLHGRLPYLEAMLSSVRFDEGKDRLFSVGDLVDRGPDSTGVLSLLRKPWFYSVKGNHEDLLLHHAGCIRRYRKIYARAMRGRWLEEFLSSSDFKDLTGLIAALPHIIVVGQGAPGRFHVVHGEISLGKGGGRSVGTDADVDAWAEGRPSSGPAFESVILWSRKIFASNGPYTPWRPGLSPTFCGHTLARTVRIRESHVNIDTGTFLRGSRNTGSGGLSLVQAN